MEDEGWKQTQAVMCQVVRVLGRAPYQRRRAVLEALAEEGLDPDLAWELATFLPMAYLRLLMARFEQMFPDTLVLEDVDGGTRELVLAELPVYQDCLRFARAVFALHPDAGVVQAVVTQGCEFRE